MQNEWQERLGSTFLPGRGFTFQSPRVLRLLAPVPLSVCLWGPPHPLPQSTGLSASVWLEAWKEIADSLFMITYLRGQNYLDVGCSTATVSDQFLINPNWNIHTAPSHSKPTSKHACCSAPMYLSDVLIASHRLKSKHELDKNYTKRCLKESLWNASLRFQTTAQFPGLCVLSYFRE